jgi:hypothetical protein
VVKSQSGFANQIASLNEAVSLPTGARKKRQRKVNKRIDEA